jgi:ribonuclease HI
VGCPPLDPDRTYVLRVKGHSTLSYSSSGIGLVLYDAHTVREVWAARKYFSRNQTPFAADYKASILGLQCAFEQGARKVVLQTDNDVMLKQVMGEYNIKKPQLQELCATLKDVLNQFSDFEVVRIAAAENTRAKNLAHRAVATKKTVGLPEDVDEEPSSDKVVDPEPDFFTDKAEDLFDDESPTIISPDKTYLLRFDGGARGNPGIAGSGMVLYDPDDMKEVWCGWKYLGEKVTNNAAEYYGLLLGVQCARSLGVRKLRAEGDSMLIVKHLRGEYKAREPNLKKMLKACKDAIQNLDFFEIGHVPRDANARADQLANQAMDTRDSFGFDELD